jgi:hypothetical protein
MDDSEDYSRMERGCENRNLTNRKGSAAVREPQRHPGLSGSALIPHTLYNLKPFVRPFIYCHIWILTN